jgi:nucleotidyltransferase/DNA polymerase involved in DNA repair
MSELINKPEQPANTPEKLTHKQQIEKVKDFGKATLSALNVLESIEKAYIEIETNTPRDALIEATGQSILDYRNILNELGSDNEEVRKSKIIMETMAVLLTTEEQKQANELAKKQLDNNIAG